MPDPSDGMGKLVARDSGKFWSARNRVRAERDAGRRVNPLQPAPSNVQREPQPSPAKTANLDEPDAAPAELAPRSAGRDVTSLALAFLAGLGLPAAFLVVRALS